MYVVTRVVSLDHIVLCIDLTSFSSVLKARSSRPSWPETHSVLPHADLRHVIPGKTMKRQPEHSERRLASEDTVSAWMFYLYSDGGAVRVTRAGASAAWLAKEEVLLSIIMFQLQSTQCSHADQPASQIISVFDHKSLKLLYQLTTAPRSVIYWTLVRWNSVLSPVMKPWPLWTEADGDKWRERGRRERAREGVSAGHMGIEEASIVSYIRRRTGSHGFLFSVVLRGPKTGSSSG